MACGMPIIAAVNGETERIIRESECGICVNIGDSNGLVESIKELIINSNLDVMRDNSRRYCEKHFNKCKLMDEMDEWIESALELEFSSVGQVRC